MILQVLEVMVSTGKGLAELTTDIQKMPQVMINVPIKDKVADLADSDTINDAVRSIQDKLGDTGRVILRPSGTEPLIRVTLEGTDENQVNQLAEELAEVVLADLGDQPRLRAEDRDARGDVRRRAAGRLLKARGLHQFHARLVGHHVNQGFAEANDVGH